MTTISYRRAVVHAGNEGMVENSLPHGLGPVFYVGYESHIRPKKIRLKLVQTAWICREKRDIFSRSQIGLLSQKPIFTLKVILGGAQRAVNFRQRIPKSHRDQAADRSRFPVSMGMPYN